MATKQEQRIIAVKRFLKNSVKEYEKQNCTEAPDYIGNTWEENGEQRFTDEHIAIAFYKNAILHDLPKTNTHAPYFEKFFDTKFVYHFKVKKFICGTSINNFCPVFIGKQWYNGYTFKQFFDIFGVNQLYLIQTSNKNGIAKIEAASVGYAFVMPLKFDNYEGETINVENLN